MSEVEPRPAQERDGPDFRRLAVTRRRFADFIDPGIAKALNAQSDIDAPTAKCIAHALGRGLGRASRLSEFARSNEGNFEEMREEYLALYKSEEATADTKQLIDWFGAYLINKEGRGSGRRFMNEYLAPKLDQILVADAVTVRGEPFVVHVPGTTGAQELRELSETLSELNLDQDEALQAFLYLYDVDASSDHLMEAFGDLYAGSFHEPEEALRALSPIGDWEDSLVEWQVDNGIDEAAMEWNWVTRVLLERLKDVYDVVERKGVMHVFNK